MVVVVALLGALGIAGACKRPTEERAPSGRATDAPAGAEVRVAPVEGLRIPDEALVDQDGNAVRLRDLMAGRVVAVNFVFTTCTTVCSPMTAVFRRVQDGLGNSMEREVRLVSISLDPATDTPERLKRYADNFGRRAGWTFLTGERERVLRVLRALGGYAAVKEEHTPVTLIGRADEGRWRRVHGIAPPDRLLAEIRGAAPRGAIAVEAAGR
ncbi:SCO family protein [Polyangium aurulentum]|nr:SCO family protein [Polyangium aurulentum]